MILFFKKNLTYFVVDTAVQPSSEDLAKLTWLFDEAAQLNATAVDGFFVGVHPEVVSPWSTNAVEITQIMQLKNIRRIEKFDQVTEDFVLSDVLIQKKYNGLSQQLFETNRSLESVQQIESVQQYNQDYSLSLNEIEINYLNELSQKLNRKLTDLEVYGFSQVNSEHCRHKIFNADFIINGIKKDSSLFQMIKQTTKMNPNSVVSAYSDNVAFIQGPAITQFAPKSIEGADFYATKPIQSVISLKAETHNFPTTVEPFSGAATGSGGEIRDRMAGGKGSVPMAGTAVYMTSYSRLDNKKPWEKKMNARKWLYQSPAEILIKASDGASDYGNKFGQPLICGSVYTFEHEENNQKLAYDKVIMLAGGVGYSTEEYSLKGKVEPGNLIILLGGDNYRIGMGGAAVSSTDLMSSSDIILQSIQRPNAEMQKRVSNVIRSFVEADDNPIVSIHDHGAGGHLNCFSELIEETGGRIDIDALPIGDPSLSLKEIIVNESQERIGLVIKKEDLERFKRVAEREKAPIYVVGEVTNDQQIVFSSQESNEIPFDLSVSNLLGSLPKLKMEDTTINRTFEELVYTESAIYDYLEQVVRLESVACKDWLTNKVDRCVGGKVAKQQTVGSLQLPLNNVGVMALDFLSNKGIATSIGHSAGTAIIDPKKGTKNSIAEALTNIIWAPLEDGLNSVSLSANWMWPCNNAGENSRLYDAVEAASEFAINLGINIPTGKDSLSMKQKYSDFDVLSPGTVIISATGVCSNVKQIVEPVFINTPGNSIYYLNLSADAFQLGGSAFAQILGGIGTQAPSILDDNAFKLAFNCIQEAIKSDLVLAGHDVASGGLITTLMEMCFPENNLGAALDLSNLGEQDDVKLLFAENAGIIVQVNDSVAFEKLFNGVAIQPVKIGTANASGEVTIKTLHSELSFTVSTYRRMWFETSYQLDTIQTGAEKATERFQSFDKIPLQFKFPEIVHASIPSLDGKKRTINAAIIREKGSNSEREMANAMYLAGFNVKDIHMTDLISGKENLEDVQFIAAVGGFSNSDVLGSAKGWAGAFLYNEKAKQSLENFIKREDTLSLGVCNGCQLFIELGILTPEHTEKPKITFNDSHKYECSFTSVEIAQNETVLFKSLSDTKLGIWVAHGEGKFIFPNKESDYKIIGKYGYDVYPANPNGSNFNTAIVASADGRHVAMMPHLERSIFSWNWANYPLDRKKDDLTPWFEAFMNAFEWCEQQSN